MSSEIMKLQRSRRGQKAIVSKYEKEIKEIFSKASENRTSFEEERLKVIKDRLEEKMAMVKKMNARILQSELGMQRDIEEKIGNVLADLETGKTKWVSGDEPESYPRTSAVMTFNLDEQGRYMPCRSKVEEKTELNQGDVVPSKLATSLQQSFSDDDF